MSGVYDLLLLLGLCLMSAGIWLIYPPAMLLFVGFVLCLVAVLGAKHVSARKPSSTSRE